MKYKKAFTLIELLVVIAIIGLLATISVIALNNARAKARDAKRVADIKQIQTALELFFNDEGRYPTAAEFNSGSIASFSSSTGGTTTYMALIPTAASPSDGSCTARQNQFYYNTAPDGESYTIGYCIGNIVGALVSGPKCATPDGISNDDCSNIFPSISGLKLRLEADAGVTKDGGNFVSSWADQSGNSNDAIQGSPTYQPSYVASVSNLNNKPVIRFSDSYFENFTLDVNQPFTVFAVYQVASNNTEQILFDNYQSRSGHVGGDAEPLYFYNGQMGSGSAGQLRYNATNYQYHYDTAITNGPASYFYEDGILKVGGNISSEFIQNGYTVGCLYRDAYSTHNYPLYGDIAELLVYDSALSDSDRQSVEYYLKTKYGL